VATRLIASVNGKNVGKNKQQTNKRHARKHKKRRPMAPGSSSKQRDYDYLFKLVLIGDSGVGKSCLLLRFAVR
jgi:hypothetical protein